MQVQELFCGTVPGPQGIKVIPVTNCTMKRTTTISPSPIREINITMIYKCKLPLAGILLKI